MDSIKKIDAKMGEIASLMSDKGIEAPSPRIELNLGGRAVCWLHAESLIGSEVCRSFYADSAGGALDKAMTYVQSLPSAEEKNNHDYMKALARVADMGRDLGIDDEYVAPLREVKKALTENLLTFSGASQ